MEEKFENQEYDHMPMIIVLHNQLIIGFVSEDDFTSFMDEKVNLLTVFDPYIYHMDPGVPCFHPFIEMSDDECYVFHRQHILTTAFPNDELLKSYIAFMEKQDNQAHIESTEEIKKQKDREELMKIINEPDETTTSVVINRKHKRTIH